MATEKFGLEAILSAKLDKQSVERDVVGGLEDAMDKASTVSPEVDMGVLERQMSALGVGDGGLSISDESVGALHEHARALKGAKVGTKVAGAAGGRLGARVGASSAGAMAGKASGAMGAIGAAAGTALPVVALGGVVAMGMLKGIESTAKHSPALSKTMTMLGQAWSLFWRPVGNYLASLIFPMAKGLLEFSLQWVKWANEGGLTNAFVKASGPIGLAIAKHMMAHPASFAVPGSGLVKGGVELVFGSLARALVKNLNEVDWRALLTDAFGPIGGAASDAVHSLFPDLTAGEVLGAIAFPSIAAPMFLSHVNWPDGGAMLGAIREKIPGFEWPEIGFTGWEIPTLNWDAYIPKFSLDFDIRLPGWMQGEVKKTQGALGLQPGGRSTTIRVPTIEGGGGGGGGGRLRVASGGIISSPTRAVIGEGGPEAVMPLDRIPSLMREGFREALRDTSGATGGGGGMDTSSLEERLDRLIDAVEETAGDVVLNVDGEEVARATQRAEDRFIGRREVYR